MKITIFGLSISSSWGNGHATTYRALCSALVRRGHKIIFFEHDAEWYANNRDVDGLPLVQIVRYQQWSDIGERAARELRDSDVGIIGSYFPDAKNALSELLDSNVCVKAFYDIDTPVTLSQLRETGMTAYLTARHIPELDIYFSFTGGPILRELRSHFGARNAVPLYCSVDVDAYKPLEVHKDFACEMSYMGTYAPDRQPKLDNLLCEPAKRMPRQKFIVAGPQYPTAIEWPPNIVRIEHLEPRYHPPLYSSSRLVLNVTRRDMVRAGHSPSVRLFEAAACGAAIVSDIWPGLEDIFTPGKEILLAATSEDSLRYLRECDDAEMRRVGRAARERILAEHSSDFRARQFEEAVHAASSSSVPRHCVAGG